jgi:hypothetical protein
MTWRQPSEEEVASGRRVNGFTFYECLFAAVDPTETKMLADYLRDPEARAQLSDNEWEGLAEWIQLLRKRLPGNPHQTPDLEVRAAARRVDDARKDWRLRNGRDPRSPVPGHVVNDLIADAIAWIAEQRGEPIPADSGLYANLERRIRTALKGRRF